MRVQQSAYPIADDRNPDDVEADDVDADNESPHKSNVL
jgi:hypothetical protein